MKIMIKSDISSLYLTFCHEFFMESRWVFSYDLENSCCWQKTIQNTPIHGVPLVAHEKLVFSKILGFIAWRFHIVSHFFDVYKIKLFLAAITFCCRDLQKTEDPWRVMARSRVWLWRPGIATRPPGIDSIMTWDDSGRETSIDSSLNSVWARS